MFFVVYKHFDFKDVKINLSTRPDKKVGDDATWDKAESALKDALDKSGHKYFIKEGDGAFWIRSTVTPEFAKGTSILVGFNSDDEVLYGLGYKCSDNCFLSTELSAEGDKLIRVSYSF